METLQKTMDDLPIKIVEDVLHRLPIKTIGQCMCVRKQWLFLIKNSKFIAANEMNKSESNRFLILRNRCKHYLEMYTDNSDRFQFQRHLTLPPEVYSIKSSAISSWNGLICFDTNDRDGDIILWNPTISKMLILPKSYTATSVLGSDYMQYLGLAFDSLTNDYKVVKILKLDDHSVVEIFSLKTFIWKVVSLRGPEYNLMAPAVPILNGVLHWLNGDKYLSRSIVSFNVHTEVFKEIELPQGLEKNCCTMTVYKQVSIAICCDIDDEQVDLEVWVMKEYGNVESWSKIWTLEFDSTQNFLSRRILHPANLLGFQYKGEMLWKIKFDKSNGTMNHPKPHILSISIDSKSGKKKYVDLTMEMESLDDDTDTHTRYFEESLMLLDNDNATSIPVWREAFF